MAAEEELGTSIPTVLERDISWVVHNVVRIRRDHYDGVLHRMGVIKTEIRHGMYQYILVCTGMYQYIQVCTSIFSKCND